MSRNRNRSKSSSKSDDLHGNAPDRSPVALLLIDVINDLDFPGNSELIRKSERLGQAIASLKQKCKRRGIPTIYINDNHGKWRSDFTSVFRHCVQPDSAGRTMVEQLAPQGSDYIVLKPKHSAFYATPLDILLKYMGVQTIILAGLTTNACVLITAGDLYIRDMKLFVPSDCVAALTAKEQRQGLQLMRKNYGANTTISSRLNLSSLLRRD